MAESGGGRPASLRRERAFVATVLALISAVLGHFVHAGWELFFTMRDLLAARAPAATGLPAAPAVAHAPDAYRVAIPALIAWLLRVVHPGDSYLVSAGIDFCCALPALLLLYGSAVRGFGTGAGRARTERWLVVVLFLAALQFPMAWVVPWQRPETLPTALYLAFALYCCVRTQDALVWLIPLFAATVWQGFVRADAAAFFGAGLFVVGLAGSRIEHFHSRGATLASGAGVALLAVGVQAYLQLVRFPHLTYPADTPVFQFRNNLSFHNLQSAVLSMLPFAVLVGLIAVKRLRMGALEWVVCVSSGLYLLLWFAVGVFAEVRIFVPYMLLLCVVAARTLAPWLMGSEDAPEL